MTDIEKAENTPAKPTVLELVSSFDLRAALSKWWKNEPTGAKAAFFSALITGFFSHLFIYSSRYYGNHDPGMIVHLTPMVRTGRWLNTIISSVSYGYVMPMTAGIFVALFLAVAAFYVCKLFDISSKLPAVLIGALLVTYPSISATNLYLYDTPNYHFAAMLAVIAVYVAAQYRFGFLPAILLLTCVLAIYQPMFNVAVTLSLFTLMTLLLAEDFDLRRIWNRAWRFFVMGLCAALLYALSLPVAFRVYDTTYNDYRGFSPESMQERLMGVSGWLRGLLAVYGGYYGGFFRWPFGYGGLQDGEIVVSEYMMTKGLAYTHLALIILTLVFTLAIIVKQHIHKQALRLVILIVAILLIPFASNFVSFFSVGGTHATMMYAFALSPIFVIIISERYYKGPVILTSLLTLCLVFTISNYIIINNAYYLKAYYFDQRTNSLTTMLLTDIAPLMPQTESKRIAFFGGLPNDDYPEVPHVFTEHGLTRSPSLDNNSFIQMQTDDGWHHDTFISNIQNLHGVYLTALPHDGARDAIREQIIATAMPAWPAEGSIAVIDDVIVINFGLVDY